MAAAVISAVVIAGALVLAVTDERAGRAVAPAAAVRMAPANPLAPEFARCQALGEAGARDASCLAAWAESRRRFLSPVTHPSTVQARPQVGRPEDE